MHSFTLSALLLVPAAPFALPTHAQTPTTAAKPTTAPAPVVLQFRAHPDWPKANPADVASPRAIVEAFFREISAPKGGVLNRTRLRSLFVPGGRIAIPTPASATRAADVVFLTPDEYADSSDQSTQDAGFFDHLLAARVEQFGAIGQVWTSYESRQNADDAKPFVRGIKVFQLMRSGGRWYLMQVSWDRESKESPIPDAYLHDGVQ